MPAWQDRQPKIDPSPDRNLRSQEPMINQSERIPEIVGWEITNQCNLSCPHCYSAAARRSHDEMTASESRNVIDIMAEIGVHMIGWTGGEPLLRNDLEELIEYAWSRGIKSNLTTNGILLDQERTERLMQSGVRAIQISLDGSTPEINRRMRGTTDDEFHKIIEAIRAGKRAGTRVVLATLIGHENIEDTKAMIQLARREGADGIRFCGFSPVGRGKHKKVKNRLDLSGNMRNLLSLAEEAQSDSTIVTSFDVSFGPVPPEFGFHKCIAGMETFYLKANGDLYPCTALTDKRFCVGNIRERSLGEIWKMPEMWAISIFPREEIHGACRSCDNFSQCRGACRGATFAHTGDLNASFPLCLYKTASETADR
jgi:radical SAM protein with 4Fe4S-binding SPASM domain